MTKMLAMSAISNKLPQLNYQNGASSGDKVPVAPTRFKRSPTTTSVGSTSSPGRMSPESSAQAEMKEKESSLVSQMRSLFEASSTMSVNKINTTNNEDVVKSTSFLKKVEEIQEAMSRTEDIAQTRTNFSYRLRVLPLDLGLAPEKPEKPGSLKELVFPHTKKPSRVLSPVTRPRRPPPKPPTQSRGKPLPPLPPVDDNFYDDNMNPEMMENAHSSPAALGIPYELTVDEELYQDADIYVHDVDSIYESMEIDSVEANKIYVNRECDEKKKKEEERRIKQTQKEQERRTKERIRVLERFNLTGEERPLEMGILKKPVRAWTIDQLSGKEGEKVAILRLKDNPAGKWLAINEKGKIGYVDLSNIEIKPEAIRSLMTMTYRSNQYDTRCDSFSEDDEIYEFIT
uniref:SH3 domain-containing protein n=1 Tax=Strigamia maritima TaxID=126957 RepID=T1JM56_STRMM